ncbi:hypothetical protein F5Y18DRAFT_443914 [Xylariaceae sp. FL1019]|nr:hypothetical protein F5Y18DRAFT_443914 [Xylariaceae sp. FL1019]
MTVHAVADPPMTSKLGVNAPAHARNLNIAGIYIYIYCLPQHRFYLNCIEEGNSEKQWITSFPLLSAHYDDWRWPAVITRLAPPAEVRGDESSFLRPSASWRRLSPTIGSGPLIRKLEVVKVVEVDDFSRPWFRYVPSTVSHSEVRLPRSGLTMGFLSDILKCTEFKVGESWAGFKTGRWALAVGRSLRMEDRKKHEMSFAGAKHGKTGRQRLILVNQIDAAVLIVWDDGMDDEIESQYGNQTPPNISIEVPTFGPWHTITNTEGTEDSLTDEDTDGGFDDDSDSWDESDENK